MAIKLFVYPKLAAQVSTSGLATEPKQDIIITELQDVNAELDLQTVELVTANTELVNQTTELQNINTELGTQTTELQSIDAELVLQTSELENINAELNLHTTELQDINTELGVQTTELQQIEAELALVKNKLAAALFTLPYDTLQVVSKTADGPTQIVSKTGGLAGTVVQTLNIIYDVDGDFESAVVS